MENLKKFRPDSKLRLMDQVRQVLRYHHYAYRTEQTYCDWIMRYIRYHGSKTHPRNMGKKEIEAFLSHLAVQQNVAASTQRQALNAIVFLYKRVLDIPVDEKLDPIRAKKLTRHPVNWCRPISRSFPYGISGEVFGCNEKAFVGHADECAPVHSGIRIVFVYGCET